MLRPSAEVQRLLAVKVLAPGDYASQDIRTPVKIAVAVLVITQLLNVALVPFMAHAEAVMNIGGIGSAWPIFVGPCAAEV